jgi:hypothetical protein
MALVSTGTNFQIFEDADKFLSVERLSASQEGFFSIVIRSTEMWQYRIEGRYNRASKRGISKWPVCCHHVGMA